MRTTVADLIAELQKMPADAFVRAYEGEVQGVVIEDGQGRELGFVPDERPPQGGGKIAHG
jgi:hypothetical protein